MVHGILNREPGPGGARNHGGSGQADVVRPSRTRRTPAVRARPYVLALRVLWSRNAWMESPGTGARGGVGDRGVLGDRAAAANQRQARRVGIPDIRRTSINAPGPGCPRKTLVSSPGTRARRSRGRRSPRFGEKYQRIAALQHVFHNYIFFRRVEP